MSALGNLPSNYKETEARAFKEADDFRRKRRDHPRYKKEINA